MIKINLAPIEELENKFWYLPEILMAAMIGIGGHMGVQFYLSQIETEMTNLMDEKRDFDKSYRRLKPDLERFDSLNKEVDQLKKKLNSLRQITVSKIVRYKPVILLEHLQNLKPEGLWFNYLKDDSSDNIIRLVGGAFDHLLVAEFMSALTETRILEVDAADVRTQVYFPRVHLERVATTGSGGFQEKVDKTDEYQAFVSTQDQKLKQSSAGNYWKAHEKNFPELTNFPGFELNIRYAERGIPEGDLFPQGTDSG